MPNNAEQQRFAQDVLSAIGAPATRGNIAFMLSWFKREGVNPSYNNPLATTLKYGSYTNINSVGVKHYSDRDTGVQATARTLMGSRYKGIVGDLKSNNPAGAANNHPDEFKAWSGGGYDRITTAGGDVGDLVNTPAVTTAGSTITPGAGPGLPPGASAEETEQYIKENYPDKAGFLNVPEIRAILIEAAKADGTGQGWSDEKLTARISATSWWRDNADVSRNFYYLQQTDPASAEKAIQRKMAELKPEFEQLGSDVSLRAIAEASLKYGWTDAQVRENYVGHLQYDSDHAGLKEGSTVDLSADGLMQMARNDYFVPLNRQDAEKWAIEIYGGTKTKEQYEAYLQSLAQGRFGDVIGQGMTPGQYMAPIRNIIADTLELSPADVNLLDQKWNEVLQHEDGKGFTRPMTLSEATAWARKRPEFRYTKSAGDDAAQLAEQIAQKFGAVA